MPAKADPSLRHAVYRAGGLRFGSRAVVRGFKRNRRGQTFANCCSASTELLRGCVRNASDEEARAKVLDTDVSGASICEIDHKRKSFLNLSYGFLMSRPLQLLALIDGSPSIHSLGPMPGTDRR